jgi:hypothetical protein
LALSLVFACLLVPTQHFSYQLMLSEAIAIVLAPKHSPNSGVFHCTLPGMKALTVRMGAHAPSQGDSGTIVLRKLPV